MGRPGIYLRASRLSALSVCYLVFALLLLLLLGPIGAMQQRPQQRSPTAAPLYSVLPPSSHPQHQQQQQGQDAPPTLGPGMSWCIRNIALNIPLPVLRSGGRLLRRLTRLSYRSDPRFTLAQDVAPGSGAVVDSVVFTSKELRDGDGDGDDYVLYLHGGAFTMCDSGDLLVARGLLPRLCPPGGRRRRLTLFSLLYSLDSSDGDGHFPAVCRELLAAWSAINALRPAPRARCLAIMGDSAGANAALCLAQQLVASQPHQPEKQPLPPLVLISPWADPFAEVAGLAKQPGYRDILNPRWSAASRRAYLGSGPEGGPGDRRDTVGLLFDASGQRLPVAELARRLAAMARAAGARCVCLCVRAWAGHGGRGGEEETALYAACQQEGLSFALGLGSSEASAAAAARCLPSALVARGLSGLELVKAAAERFGVSPSHCVLLGGAPLAAVGSTALPLAHAEASGGGRAAGAGLRLRVALPALHSLLSSNSQREGASLASAAADAVDRAAVGLVCPLHAPESTLRALPRALVLTGSRELLQAEGEALARALGPSCEHYDAPGDIHAFLIHHQHPLRLTLGAAGMAWVFERLYPGAARQWRASGCDSSQCAEAMRRVVDFIGLPAPSGLAPLSAASAETVASAAKNSREKLVPASVPRFETAPSSSSTAVTRQEI